MADFSNLTGTTGPDPVDVFRRTQEERKKRASLQASTMLSQRPTFQPEQRASDVNLSFALKDEAKIDMPPQMVGEKNRPQLQFQLDQTRINRLTQESERAANYLTDPLNAELAYDDLNTIGQWAGLGNAVARGGDAVYDNARLKPRLSLLRTLERSLADSDKEFGALWGEEQEDKPTLDEVGGGFGALQSGLEALPRYLWAYVAGEIGEEPIREAQAGVLQEIGTEAQERQEAFPGNLSFDDVNKRMADMPDAAGPVEGLVNVWNVAKEDPLAFVSWSAQVAAESIPGIAAATATTLATRNPRAGAAVMGTGSAIRAEEGNFREIAQSAGYDLTDRESVQAMLDDPEFVDRMSDQAFTYGLVVGVIDGLSGGIASTQMLKNPAGEFLVQMMVQATAGSAGEALGRFASGQAIDWTEVVTEGIVELVTGPLEIAGVGGRATVRRAQAAAAANDRKKVFQAMSDASGESKLKGRSERKYGEMVAEMTKDGPIETMYVDPDQMETLFQSEGITAEEFFETLPELDQKAYQHAVETGSDFAIPTSVYASKIIGSKLEAALQDHLKFGPLEMSLAEANNLKKDIENSIKDVTTTIEKIEKEVGGFSDDGRIEYERLTGQLRQAGRTPEVAAREALPLVRFAETQAQRAGITSGEFLRRYTLPSISADYAPQRMRSGATLTPSTDPLPAPVMARLGETDAEATGDQIAEAVIDAVEAGEMTSADAAALGVVATGIDAPGSTTLNQAPLDATPFETDRLPGLEKASPGPVPGVRDVASQYMRDAGLPVRHQAEYVKVDVERATEIARLYEEMEDAPNDPEVRAAYEALAAETLAQYEALLALGIEFEWITGEDPYAAPADAIRDMQENKHLYVFPTESGFGTNNEANQDHPLLAKTGIVIDGREAVVNDIFRIVHDVFGHGSEGASFGPRGEENAWQAHVRMFTPLAARAMTSETRGQNSWVNYGPHGEQNRMNPHDTVFADQKTGLLPEWVSTIGQAEDVAPEGADFGPLETKELSSEEIGKLQEKANQEMGKEPISPLSAYKALGLGGVVTAESGIVEIDTATLAALPGTAQENRVPGDDKFESLMRNVNAEGFDQRNVKDAVEVRVNHLGEAYIYEGNTRVAVASYIGRPTVKAKIKWMNGAPVGPLVAPGTAAAATDYYGTPLREDGKLVLTHWSNEKRSTLDPEKAGTGPFRMNNPGPKQTFYGVGPGYAKEFGLGNVRHTVAADPDRMYPFYEDPAGLKAGVDRSKTDAQQVDQYLRIIKDAGYLGAVFTDNSIAVTFEPVEVESAIDESRVLFQEAMRDQEPIFYSALQRAVEGAKQEVASAKDWASIIDKLPGVKKAEVQWTGVLEFLAAMDPKAKVTRAELAGYIERSEPTRDIFTDVLSGSVEEDRDAAVDEAMGDYQVDAINERILEEDSDYLLENGMDVFGDEIWAEMVEEDDSLDPDLVDSDNREFQNRVLARATEEYEADPHMVYDIEITWPGGETEVIEATVIAYNYGEVYHDGTEYRDLDDARSSIADAYTDSAWERAFGVADENRTEGSGNDFDAGTRWEQYTEKGGENYREVLIRYDDLERSGPNARFEGLDPFINSSHFESPNILVHTRVKDRRDADGGRVLFVEEVQSDLNTDWREAGGQTELLGPVDEEARAELLSELDAQRNAASEREMEAVRARILAEGQLRRDAGVEMRKLLDNEMFSGVKQYVEKDAGISTLSETLLSFIKTEMHHGDAAYQMQQSLNRRLREYNLTKPDGINLDLFVNMLGHTVSTLDAYTAAKEAHEDARRARAEIEAVEEQVNRLGGNGGAPDRPFTPFEGEATYALAMKRMLRMAAEEGYDKLAWTPAYMQARRWSGAVQNVVKSIEWKFDPAAPPSRRGELKQLRMSGVNGGQDFFVDREGVIVEAGPGRVPNSEVKGKKLSELIGGVMATRVMEEDSGTIEGQNIVIGGDGYKIAYDQQMKKFVEKFAKKYGSKLTVDTSMPDFALSVENAMTPAELRSRFAAEGYERIKKKFSEKNPDRFRPEYWEALERAVDDNTARLIDMHKNGAQNAIAEGRGTEQHWLDQIEQFKTPEYQEEARIRQLSGAITVGDAYDLLDIEPPKKRSDAVWSVEITDQMREELLRAQPLFQRKGKEAPRGQIMLPPPGSDRAAEISLFEGADLSTMLHESGHFYLYTLERMKNDGVEHATTEWNTLFEWFARNVEDVAKEADLTPTQMTKFLKRGTLNDADLDRKANKGIQEYFARGMERYMLEGKAPSNALRAAFESFMAWLLAVYRDAKNLRVNLDDEVRSVFDRLLATDAEIADMQAENNIDSTISETAKAMGIDEDTYARLVELTRDARDEARQLTLKEIMAPIRAMREKENKEAKKEITARVTDEVMAKRHNRVIQWLGNGRWIGGEVPEQIAEVELRLDPALLAEEHGEGVEGRLPRASRPLTLKGSGVSADDIAGLFGYRTGADMIQDLLRAPKAQDEIKNRVDAAMKERVDDPMDEPGAIEQVAVDALHGEKRGQLIVAELRAINRLASRKQTMTSRAQARAIAREMIGRMPVRDAIASHRYLAAERKFAEQASRDLAAGNVEEAFEAKRKQLINHALYSESRAVSDTVAKTERLVGRLRKRSTRKNLAGEYLEAIDELIDRYDFRQISGAAENRRGALLAYVEMMKKANRENELAIPDKVLHDARRRPYKALPVRELEGVYDSLKNIEHTARMKQKLRDAKAQRDLDAVVNEIVQSFEEHIGDGRPPERIPTRFGKIRNNAVEFANLVLNADTILRRIDGWTNRGAAYRHLKGLIDDAENTALVMREKAAIDMEALYDVYSKTERMKMTRPKVWRGYDTAISKWDLISIALNTGNKDNFERLTSLDTPGAFTREQVETLVEQLDDRDWKFVQSVWSYIDSYWGQIAERERRTTGVAPKKVDAAMMVDAPAGVNGGYYPIKYDARFSATVSEEQEQDIFTNMQRGRFGKAQTRNGHLKERAAGGGGRTVQLGMQVFHGHVAQVVHDLAFSEAVNATWKILQDPRIKGAFESRSMLEDHKSLEIWVQDVGSGRIMTTGILGRLARHAKAGFTLSKLAFNFGTVALQITGLPQSSVVVGHKNMVKALGQYAAGGFYPIADKVKNRSPFMANRETSFQRDIYDLLDNTQSGPVQGVTNELTQFWMRAGFWMMQKVQFYTVDVPTWMAGYEQGLAEGMSDEEAGKHGDRMVARAQASGLFADRSAIERGTLGPQSRQNEFVRLFTALGSYMFNKYNVATEVVGKARRDIDGVNARSFAAAMEATFNMALVFTLEAVLYAAIKGRLPDDEDDEDDTWLRFLARETALSAMGTLPFVRDVASAMQGFSGGGAYGGVLETGARAMNSFGKMFGDEELTFSDAKAGIDAVGIAVPGVPSTFIKTVVDAELERQSGEDVSPLEYLFGVR